MAIKIGHSVLFTPATTLLTTLARAHAEGRLEDRLAFYAKSKLLIVDELGYLPFAPNAEHLFFPAGLEAAILDRLRHSYVVTIRGDSYRLREKRRSGDQRDGAQQQEA